MIVLKGRSCGITGHRSNCCCDPKIPVESTAPYDERNAHVSTATQAPPDTLPRVLGDRILIEMPDPITERESGLVVVESAAERPNRAVVLAVGSGHMTSTGERVPLEVLPGDTILFSKYGGTEFEHNDTEYMALQEAHVLAILPAGDDA